MAHILVFQDDPSIRKMIAEICREEGHSVMEVSTVEDALMVLRTTLHPVVGIMERDHSSMHPDFPLFPTIRDHPELYGQHRYIAITWWHLTDDDEALLRELGLPWLAGPFAVERLLDAVNAAIASLTCRC